MDSTVWHSECEGKEEGKCQPKVHRFLMCSSVHIEDAGARHPGRAG